MSINIQGSGINGVSSEELTGFSLYRVLHNVSPKVLSEVFMAVLQAGAGWPI